MDYLEKIEQLERQKKADANAASSENEINAVTKLGDGQLNQPPQTEAELRRLLDHLEDPKEFAAWLEGLMLG